MDPITIGTIIAALQAGIEAAPKVVALVVKAKNAISALVGAKLVSIEQQAAIWDHLEAVSKAALAGETPPAWLVEPDPV
jgi:hypothetical protein